MREEEGKKKKQQQLHWIQTQTQNTLDCGFIRQLLRLLFIMSIRLWAVMAQPLHLFLTPTGSMRGETLAQRPAFLPLSFWFLDIGCVVGVVFWVFFFFWSSFPLSPHRLLAVIFVFIEDAFGAAAAAAAV